MNHDITHCKGLLIDGEVCNQRASCRRYQAHRDAVSRNLGNVLYMEPRQADWFTCPQYYKAEGGEK